MSPALVVLLSLSACKKEPATPAGDSGDSSASSPILSVPETERWTIPELACDAHVVRTEAAVPHIYAHDRVDLARVYGFVQAQDRYFEMELVRRLGLGTVSELLGQDALETDMESRATGMTWVADNILDQLTDDELALLDGFAEGVNAYIAAVKAGDLPLPSELQLAGPILGATDPTELMEEWDRRDLAGAAAVLVYELGFETDDVGTAATAAVVDDVYDPTDALYEYRQAGLVDDIWSQVVPVRPVSSTTGWGTNGSAARSTGPDRGADGSPGAHRSLRGRATGGRSVPVDMLQRLATRLERHERRLGRGDLEAGWGSNVWAVSAALSSDGTALLAGDGHLPLSVPSLFYQVGLDTRELGGGDTHQLGLGIPGLPIMAVGTNGQVAWSQTQLMGDITDWYREELQVDADGVPQATRFQGEWQPVVAVEESHEVAEVPALGSVGRTVTWTRYQTFDGRWIVDIEGVEVGDEDPGVTFPGTRIHPEDTDGDGVITAISFDYTAFSGGTMLHAVDRFGHSSSVEEFRDATRYLIAYSQNMGVADASGSILYTGYQAVPCRGYLPRNADGTWVEGADPTMLIDGTTYGGFTIPTLPDGMVDESQTDPYACVVPWDEYPTALDPAQGYVVNANNDPAGITLDNDLLDEPWYIGGPWVEGFRAWRITERIEQAAADGTADEAGMAAIQGDHKSALGAWFAWHLVEAIEAGRAAAAGSPEPGSSEARMAELYAAEADALDEVQDRIEAWAERGYVAHSGVETFYNSPDADSIDDSIATTLFNAWLQAWDDRVFGDEGLPGVWRPGGTTGRTRALTMFLEGRGPGNPGGLSSWNPETEESAFFDILGTEEIETSDEVALLAMLDGLAFLRSEPGEDLRGTGFGTDDISRYKWGLRHQVRFESVLADFLGDDDYSFLTDRFAITTDTLPLQGEAGTEDLHWFPRPGDNLAVDAANNGWGPDFTHSSGPVFRMVIALADGDFVSGRNVIPGGQSALIDSDHFADQAALWLANDTLPMRFFARDVADAATGRALFPGADGDCP
ncbi:MAG: penicillin acylase family protein [Deltaproteobacteria bacterium]|nr:MAG: penicillin acylase family protein [Deltaproteobacteria bacterium]